MYPKCASNHSSSLLCCLLKCLRGIKHFTRGAIGDIFPHSFQFQTAAHTHHNIKVTNTDRCPRRIQMLLGFLQFFYFIFFIFKECFFPMICNRSTLGSLSCNMSGCALLSTLRLVFTEGGLPRVKGCVTM